jgi:hypothetical protein
VNRFKIPATLFLLASACTPDIEENPPPDPNATIVVEFDPGAAVPVVPAPNDLAKDPARGKLLVPTYATDSPAQAEFNTSYLNTLDGFPFESTASVRVTGDLNVSSVNAANVIAIDLTDPAKPVPVTGHTPTYANKVLSIAAPLGGWTRGHRYAIALYSGSGGLVGAKGERVTGSATWGLISQPTPLVTCPDLKTNCKPAVDIIPAHSHDPAERLAEQTAAALRLEQLRLGYKPILDALTAQGKPRETIPIVWTFSIVNAGEVLFDPADGIIPFPNDVLRDPATGKVKLPNPKTREPITPADCAGTDTSLLLVCGLNTLDGFSTTVPLLSENSADLGALEQGTIDPKTLSLASVGLAKVKSDAPTSVTDPKYTPCINCGGSNPAATLQTLQWKLLAPLDERSTYLAYVTTDVKDDQGKNVVANPVFALVRSSKPLVVDGKSAVSIISNEQAALLEPLRAGMAPALDALATKGVTRDKIALAFAFTTQSEASDLDKIRGIPAAAAAAGLPDFPVANGNVTSAYVAALDAASVPHGNISRFFAGAFLTPVAVTGPSGTLNPTGAKVLPVPYVMSVPAGTPPTGGWGVTIFGHGLGQSRNGFLSLADALASVGQIVIATDTLFHGERTSCTGSLATIKQSVPAATSDDASCQDPTTMKCDGDAVLGLCVLRDDSKRPACTVGPTGDGVCSAQGAGRCAKDGKCQGVVSATSCTPGESGNAVCGAAGLGLCGTTGVCTGSPARMGRKADGSVVLSGHNFFNAANPFGTRDNFRQQVIDLEQLVRVLKSTATTNLAAQIALANGGAIPFNTARINFVGQSLGSILGSLFNAVSPDTNNVALNVGGGSISTLLLKSPDAGLTAARTSLLATLAAQGIQPGTPAFDQFIGSLQWIVDPADPANVGFRLTHGVSVGGVTAPNPNRKVFLQFIQNDQFVINETNLALVASANRSFDAPAPPRHGCVAPLFCYEFRDDLEPMNTTSAPLAGRHGFLLVPPSNTAGGLAITTKAQTQVATFIATGALP